MNAFRGPGKVALWALVLFVCLVWTRPARAESPEGAMASPASPGLPPIDDSRLGSDQRWSVSPAYSFYMLPGGGLSRYFDQAFGVGGELSWRIFPSVSTGDRPVPENWKNRLRWLGDFSYLQMTPGPTLAPSISSNSSSVFSSVSPSPTPPIPGSASISGFILRTGLAWDQPELTPEKWGLRRIIVPYLRIDAGGVDLAVSNVPGMSGHPYGALLDLGAGLNLKIPEYPLGVFGEIDPTLMDIEGNIVTITPLVAGIMWRF